MIAAKHFDPVLGLDIHIIQPPGPVPPLPVPHPFIGMLIDLVEYAPYIGGTVKVNGMMRGVAGTGGKNLPPHIPIGGVFVPPIPGNECTVFTGSSTVAFDSDPASRLGDMVLSCQSIGLPPPPRPKPHNKPKSQYLPTTILLAVPMGPLVLVGGPPTITIFGALKVLGPFIRWFQQASKYADRFEAFSQKAMAWATRVLGPRLGWLANKGICFLTGHPVDVASGQVLTEGTDVELPGPLPFKFERIWFSASTHRGPLGHGWHHSFDLALTEYDAGYIVRLTDGRGAIFPPLKEGESFYNRKEKLFLRRTADGHDLEDLNGLVHHFGWVGRKEVERPLEHVRDPNGNTITLVREKGKLIAFVDSGGRRLPVVTDAAGRITEIHGPDPDKPGETFAMVSYRYSRDGDLVEVRDALGNPFRYEYGNHLLLRETDRSGLSFYFMYDADGPRAKCLRTWGDGNVFLRELSYDTDRQRTEVIDSLGHKHIYEWNDLGAVTRAIDPLGGETKTEWSVHGDKLAVIDANGKTISVEYDPFGRLLAVTDPAGGTAAYQYDEAGNAIGYTDPVNRVWLKEFDRKRNLIAITDPLGYRESFEVDSRGLLTRWVDAKGNVAISEWNQAGLLHHLVDRCGAASKFVYDSLGRLIVSTDALGHVTQSGYDRRGLLTKFLGPLGQSQDLTHDASGYLASYRDAAGRTTEIRHAALGRLASVRTPSGRMVRYRFDTEGELSEVLDPGKHVWSYTRDAAGRISEERTWDGRILQYGYDHAGQVTGFINGRGQQLSLKRDASGRVIERMAPDGSKDTFTYDFAGAMTSASNAAAAVKWNYDRRGALGTEIINRRALQHQYDAAGNRIRRTSPLGRTIEIAHDAEGRIVSAKQADQELFRSTLDPLGREQKRVCPTGAGWEWEYLPTGEQAAVRGLGGVQTARTHSYDESGRPTRQIDRTFGQTTFTHDDDGCLVAVQHDGVTERLYQYDTSGDIRPEPRIVIRRDADGNTIEKIGPRGKWNYEYDVLGRLIEARPEAGTVVRFAYDALGRRVRKSQQHTETEYFWDGDFALGESGDAGGEYLYRPGSFEPLARLANTTQLLELDPVGIPRSALDINGSTIWQAAFEPFGQVRNEQGQSGLVAVRYPGQLADPETGLVYNWFRYLDPDQYAYMTPDPLGLVTGGRVYNYVISPLMWVDPFGLSCKPPGLSRVTSWAADGITPDLKPGRWVMLGGGHWWNYLKSGLPGGKLFFNPMRYESSGTSIANHVTEYIEKSALAWPPGWEKWKGILGQRVIK